MKIVVGMSGGVDSSLAAALVKEQGHDVLGVTMILTRKEQIDAPGFINHGSIEEANDAKAVADKIGIDFETWNMSELYKEKVVMNFIREYSRGRTPNPCVSCNQNVKFAALVAKAQERGYDKIATGHYARVKDGQLYRGVNPLKDQSYFVASMPPEVVKRCYFPLGDYEDKAEVRKQAKAWGFETHDKKDSSDICFLEKGSKAKFLSAHFGKNYQGNIVDIDGNILGEHNGYWNFTIGQRQGLNIKVATKDGKPRYVVAIKPKEKEVVVGPKEALYVRSISCNDIRIFDSELCSVKEQNNCEVDSKLIAKLNDDRYCFEGNVQIRAHGKAIPSLITYYMKEDKIVVEVLDNKNSEKVELFDSVASGQSLVVYDIETNSRVMLKATIESGSLG